MTKLLGIDVGSTTVKVTVIEPATDEILYKSYERHFSRVKECVLERIEKGQFGCIRRRALSRPPSRAARGWDLAEKSRISFVQEVQAAFIAIRQYYPDADVGGGAGRRGREDHLYHGRHGTAHERQLRGRYGRLYRPDGHAAQHYRARDGRTRFAGGKDVPIASRCGVFAKSDIQPLLNQGAAKSDISASIFPGGRRPDGGGLAQGRRIKGKVLFLGGPLFFLKALRRAFTETLKLDEEHADLSRKRSLLYVSRRARCTQNADEAPMSEIIGKIENSRNSDDIVHGRAAFQGSGGIRRLYRAPQAQRPVSFADIHTYRGDAYLGIDSGSTTTKMILITEDIEILYSHYQSNNGQPLDIVAEKLKEIYALARDRVNIRARRGDGVRRGPHQGRPQGGFRHRRNGGAFQSGAPFQSQGGFHHRHRRSGHQVL